MSDRSRVGEANIHAFLSGLLTGMAGPVVIAEALSGAWRQRTLASDMVEPAGMAATDIRRSRSTARLAFAIRRARALGFHAKAI